MKFVVLAATIGYVFGAADGVLDGDCNADTACADGTYCNTNDDTAGAGSITAESVATSGLCKAVVAAGAVCTTDAVSPLIDAPCATGYTCDGTCKGDVGSACKAAVTVTNDDGIAIGSTTQFVGFCDTDTNADGTNDDGAVTDCTDTTGASGTCAGTAATGVAGSAGEACRTSVTPNDPLAATPATETTTANYPDCTGTATCEGEVTTGTLADGTCTAAAIAAGLTGGPCKAASAAVSADDAVTACDASLATTNCPAAGAASTDTTTYCGAASIADAADGADGGNCRLVVAEATEVLACDKAAVVADTTADPPVEASPADVCNGADAAATPPVVGTCGAPVDDTTTDDSPAAIFYGMSMVTAAIAYLL